MSDWDGWGAQKKRTRKAGGEARRQALLAVARELLNKLGHADRVTMEMVARESGYSVGSVYLSFPSKEDLFGALLKEEIVGKDPGFLLTVLTRYVPLQYLEVLNG